MYESPDPRAEICRTDARNIISDGAMVITPSCDHFEMSLLHQFQGANYKLYGRDYG